MGSEKFFDVATIACMVILVLALIAGTVCAIIQLHFLWAFINAIMCVYAVCVTGSLLNEK
jgi:hypothetical protein